jgi:hypothetical protein
MLQTCFHSYAHISCRPASLGTFETGNTCGNLFDANLVVSSVGMCASYALQNQLSGFCILGGGQCFTPRTRETLVEQDIASIASVACSTPNAMTCYKFDQTTMAKRREVVSFLYTY